MISLGTFWSRCGRRDEVAKGDWRAVIYSELALRTSLTRKEPNRGDYLGKAPRGDRAQPGINVKVYYSRRRMADDANKQMHRVSELHSRRATVLWIKKSRYTTPPQEEQCGRGGHGFTPWSASDELRRGLVFYTLVVAELTSRISVAGFPWGLYTGDVELAAA